MLSFKIAFIFAVFCLAFTSGKILPLNLPSVGQIPSGGQNISIQGTYATSSFSFGGLFFMTLAPSRSESTLMAFNNVTYEFVQKEVLDYPCFNPQYSLNSNDDTSFFLLCSSASDITGSPVVWVVRPIQGLFFRVIASTNLAGYSSSNWTWIDSTPYLWNMDQANIVSVYSSSGYVYTSTFVYDFQTWATDLQDFTWTNMSIITYPLTLLLTGHLQGVNALAVVSSSGSYSLVSGSFNGISLLFDDGVIFGLTTSPSSNGATVVSLWDFSKLSSAKPTLIQSLTFNSFASIVSTTIPTDALSATNSFFVSQMSNNMLNVTQVGWSSKGLTPQQFFYGPSAIGVSTEMSDFFVFNYGYTTRYPY